MVQLLWFVLAQLIVQHAAYRAARSAVVLLDDDPQYYRGAPRGQVILGSDNSHSLLSSLTSGKPLTKGSLPLSTGSSRLTGIRQSAYAPLLLLTPSSEWSPSSVRGTLSGPSSRLTTGLLWLQSMSAITLRSNSPQREIQSYFHPHEMITVRVSLLYPCLIPLLQPLFCHSRATLQHHLSQSSSDFPSNQKGSFWGQLFHPKKNRGQSSLAQLAEEMRWSESPEQTTTLLSSGRFYRLLQAEVQLPNQGATYHPQEEQ